MINQPVTLDVMLLEAIVLRDQLARKLAAVGLLDSAGNLSYNEATLGAQDMYQLFEQFPFLYQQAYVDACHRSNKIRMMCNATIATTHWIFGANMTFFVGLPVAGLFTGFVFSKGDGGFGLDPYKIFNKKFLDFIDKHSAKFGNAWLFSFLGVFVFLMLHLLSRNAAQHGVKHVENRNSKIINQALRQHLPIATFDAPLNWQDNQVNHIPAEIACARGLLDNQIIAVNGIRYRVQQLNKSTEPTNQNPMGNVFRAIPMLRGG